MFPLLFLISRLLILLIHCKDSSKVQIIDKNGIFIKNPELVVTPYSTGISIAAWLGLQSSGKSTLSNGVLNTSFAVMNESATREQTTEGVWLGVSQTPPEYAGKSNVTLLSLDLQGQDSYKSRGRNAETFDNRAALFAVAMSDVVVLNMWECDINRRIGGGSLILERVLGSLMKLGTVGSKPLNKTLLFVVQNYRKITPVNVLTGIIEKMLKEIWAGLNNAADVDMASVFRTVVYPLPHILLPESNTVNETLVDELRQMFFNPTHPKYLFSGSTGRFADIDEVLEVAPKVYCEVCADKDLEVATLQELVRERRRIEAEHRREREKREKERAEERRRQEEREEKERAYQAELKALEAQRWREKQEADDRRWEKEQAAKQARLDAEKAEKERKDKNHVRTYYVPYAVGQPVVTKKVNTKRRRHGIGRGGFLNICWINEECDEYVSSFITITQYMKQYEVKVYESGREERGSTTDISPIVTTSETKEAEEDHKRNCERDLKC